MLRRGLRLSGLSVAVNVVLAGTKIAAGVVGNSYALVADGIESTADIVSSLVVWSGLRISARPPDRTHPYGHGKAESFAAALVSLALIGAGLVIAAQSIREIRTPHHAPAWYTLLVLLVVITVKETMYRLLSGVGESLGSQSLKADSWHHRSDAITSVAAFLGISIALIGGRGYESADDWGALAACGVILYNGVRLLRPAVDEMMDAAVPQGIEGKVRGIAAGVDGVVAIEKCRIRKSGLGLLMDIHVTVDGDITVRRGHEIAHDVVDRLFASRLKVVDVVVHTEPDTMQG
ncbi:MAG: cation diffusion facilitator family transporter [Candidatus Krumholzibacteriia bacterium]